MPNLGPTELIIIAIVIMLLFGAKRMPDAARSLGRSLRIFKAETKKFGEEEDESAAKSSTTQQQASQPQQLPPGQPQDGSTLNGQPVSETERSHESR